MSGGKFECSGLSAGSYSRAYGAATSPTQNGNQSFNNKQLKPTRSIVSVMADIADRFGPGMGAGLRCGGRGSGEHGAALLAVPPFAGFVVAIPVRLGRTPHVPLFVGKCIQVTIYPWSQNCHYILFSSIPFGRVDGAPIHVCYAAV